MRITLLGDSALTVHVGSEYATDSEAALREVAEMLGLLNEARLPGVLEITPAFDTLGVFYDPVRIAEAGAPEEDIAGWLREKITALSKTAAQTKELAETRVIEIPVCYEKEFALDLAVVAQHTGLSQEEVIAAHAAASYRIACIGFVPGFPFLAGLPAALATPRLPTPRTAVPAGSVAIGGAQTGIYPQSSPGGWNIIGRTPCRLFAADRVPPSLLATGDQVRFRSITRSEFEALAVAAVCDPRSAESSQMSPGESAVIDRRYRE